MPLDIIWAITGNRSLRIHAVKRGANKSVCGAHPNPRKGWLTNTDEDEGAAQRKYKRCPVCVQRLSSIR